MEYEKLGRIRDAYKECKQLREQIYEFEQMRISPRGAVYGSERVQSSARGDIQPDNIARLDKLLNDLNAKLQISVELIAEFEAELEKLSERERCMLRMYYVDCMTWEQVCVEMNMSWTNLHRIRRAAIAEITGEN